MKQEKRYLSHLLLLHGEILANHICTVGCDWLISAVPFGGETASTEFVDGILVAGNEKLPLHIDNLKSLIVSNRNSDLRSHAESIRSYIMDNNLGTSETKNTVLISIGKERVRIIHNLNNA